MTRRPAASRVRPWAGRRGSRDRRSCRLPALVAIAALALLLFPSVALAHAQLTAVDPPDGARLEASPTQVSLTFNEPVVLTPQGVGVIDGQGRSMDAGPEEADGAVVRQPLTPLPDGWYVASWSIISQDGHILRGASVFGVGEVDAAGRPSPGASTDASGLLATVARALSDLGLIVAAGAWLAWWLLRARTGRVRQLAFVATGIAAVATFAWGLDQLMQGGAVWGATPTAIATLLRLVLIVGALLLARMSSALAAVLLLVALWTLGFGGHATGSTATSLLIAIHLTAAVVWLGAAPTVALVLRDREFSDADALSAVRRFSRAAGFALIAVGLAGAVTGLILTDAFAGGITTYALVLGAKVVIVVLAAALGFFGRRSIGSDPRRSRFRRIFLIDAGLLVAVVVLSSLLTTIPPEEGHAEHGAAGSPRCSALVGDTSASVVVSPGRTGANQVDVAGVSHEVRGVTLELTPAQSGQAALEVSLEHATVGWSGSAVLPLAGDWEAIIVVRVDTFTEERGACTVTVVP